jgi:hypothetical protein
MFYVCISVGISTITYYLSFYFSFTCISISVGTSTIYLMTFSTIVSVYISTGTSNGTYLMTSFVTYYCRTLFYRSIRHSLTAYCSISSSISSEAFFWTTFSMILSTKIGFYTYTILSTIFYTSTIFSTYTILST